jgi:predicted aspartyl protease
MVSAGEQMARNSYLAALALFLFDAGWADEGATSAQRSVAAELPAEEKHLYAAPTRRDRIGRIAAPVMINGVGPFRLILDTGANHTVITQRVADVLGLPIALDSKVLLHGVTGSLAVPTARLTALHTGDLVQHDLSIAVLPTVMGAADGILGTQGFEGMRITVNFAKDSITIARSNNRRARSHRGEGTIPATLRFGRLLVVDGYAGTIPIKAVIDTGAQSTLGNLALRDALLRKRRVAHSPDDASVMGLDETGQTGRYLRTPRIRLGDAMLEDVSIIYGEIYVFKLWDLEEEPAMLVGMDVLGTLELLVVDYLREEIQIRNRLRSR